MIKLKEKKIVDYDKIDKMSSRDSFLFGYKKGREDSKKLSDEFDVLLKNSVKGGI